MRASKDERVKEEHRAQEMRMKEGEKKQNILERHLTGMPSQGERSMETEDPERLLAGIGDQAGQRRTEH